MPRVGDQTSSDRLLLLIKYKKTQIQTRTLLTYKMLQLQIQANGTARHVSVHQLKQSYGHFNIQYTIFIIQYTQYTIYNINYTIYNMYIVQYTIYSVSDRPPR